MNSILYHALFCGNIFLFSTNVLFNFHIKSTWTKVKFVCLLCVPHIRFHGNPFNSLRNLRVTRTFYGLHTKSSQKTSVIVRTYHTLAGYITHKYFKEKTHQNHIHAVHQIKSKNTLLVYWNAYLKFKLHCMEGDKTHTIFKHYSINLRISTKSASSATLEVHSAYYLLKYLSFGSRVFCNVTSLSLASINKCTFFKTNIMFAKTINRSDTNYMNNYASAWPLSNPQPTCVI